MEDQEAKIKGIIEEMLEKLTVNFSSLDVSESCIKGTKSFLIKTDDSGILIGNDGANLKALNHIVKEIVDKKEGRESKTFFFVDVNDYHSQKIQRIKDLALESAKKASLFKRDVEMDPMTSYERMIIHAVLSEERGILTESEGEGDFRKVVIKVKN